MPKRPRISWIQYADSSFSSCVRPETGSSRRRSLGSVASARPSSTRFWTPYGQSATRLLRTGSRLRNSMISSQRRRWRISSPRARRRAVRKFFRKWRCRPTIRLSSTLMLWNRRRFWNVRAIPRRVIASGVRPSTDSLRKATPPAVGR